MVRRSRVVGSEAWADPGLINAVKAVSRPLRHAGDLDPLVGRIGEARFVLIGEASHGTSEYYTWRAELTRRLIAERSFSFVAVEGDWPDCYEVNRFVKGHPDTPAEAREALEVFTRWPTWMWANEEVADFIGWLREYNASRPEGRKVGFYGLDVYSLWDSLHAVMGYLRRERPEALAAAVKAYRCLEPYAEDPQEYARAAAFVPDHCRDEVVGLLRELRKVVPSRDGDAEAHFVAEQNALVLRNAEDYYRNLMRGGAVTWNIRDRHMAETLDRLVAHHGPGAKAVVWEHNTHIGDARFTDMAEDGMVNVGQLAREAHGDEGVVLVGFGSYQGSVIAADEWGAPMTRMLVPPARPHSWEEVLHRAGGEDRLLLFGEAEARGRLAEPRGHRAIGVVYHPGRESYGNYVPTVLPRRYDAFLYLDETEALRPFGLRADESKVPDTYPAGV